MTPTERAPWRALETVPRERVRTPDELVERHAGEVWRFVLAQVRGREDAEDAVMETFAAAFRDFGRVQRADDPRGWLLAVARRRVADLYRRKYRRAEEPLTDEIAATEGEARWGAAREALAGLPEGQREALALKYVAGLSTEEVGRQMRRSTAATNSLLQRGRESLRAALALSDSDE